MRDDLLRYASGAMDDEEAASFEERLFEDEGLHAEAAILDALRAALREMAARGPLVPVVDEAGLEVLRARARVHELRPRAGRIDAVLGDEEFLIAHVEADLADARRVDVEFCSPDGTPYFRVREAPFTGAGVIVACEAHVARAAGHLRLRVLDEQDRVRADVEIVNA